MALSLAERGFTAIVLERKSGPLQAASYGNEGKIHMGFVYALDSSGNTGREMLRGALSFAPLIEKWCGPMPWHKWKSGGFRYAIMPDSLADMHTLEAYYEKLRGQLGEIGNDLPVNPAYFGDSPSWMWRRSESTTGSPLIDGEPVNCIDTEEISIDTRPFSEALLHKIKEKSTIVLRCDTRVVSAERRGTGFLLEVETLDSHTFLKADVVINCSWADRIRLDRTADIPGINGALSYRVKHRVIVRPRHGIQNLLPVTMVQGPFGDVVPFKDGSVYLSWYPECRTYFNQHPPSQEFSSQFVLDNVSHRTINAMSNMFPQLKNATAISCSPCMIVAQGMQDVDDPDSGLHRRTSTGPHGGNGWWSVDTGKLTLAPLHGESTAKLVLGELGLDVK